MSDPTREALARILHEQFMMPGHAFPDAPWKDACSESADQLLDYLGRAGLALAALSTPPPSLDVSRLKGWVASHAVRQGKLPYGATVVDAEELHAYLDRALEGAPHDPE